MPLLPRINYWTEKYTDSDIGPETSTATGISIPGTSTATGPTIADTSPATGPDATISSGSVSAISSGATSGIGSDTNTDTNTIGTNTGISTTPGGLPFPSRPFSIGNPISIPIALAPPIATITSTFSIPPSLCAAPPTFTFNRTITRTIFEPVSTGSFPSPLKREAANKRQEKREARRYEQSPVPDSDTRSEEEEAASGWQSAFKLPIISNHEHVACFICSWDRSGDLLTSEFYVSFWRLRQASWQCD
ncbi:MAG: hypothetical protein Q9160_004961 [Pyrenula sp. 1 TL-2023]